MKDHSNGSRADRPIERIQSLGTTVHRVPPREEIPDLIAQITAEAAMAFAKCTGIAPRAALDAR